MAEGLFFVDGLVRDSELDSQGGVSNDNLMEYFQHGRHEYFRARGFSLKAMLEQRLDPVLSEAHLKFVRYLEHADEYRTVIKPVRAGVLIHCLGAIYRLPDLKLCCKSIMTVVVSKDGSITRDNPLNVAEGPLGRKYEPSFKDVPDSFDGWISLLVGD